MTVRVVSVNAYDRRAIGALEQRAADFLSRFERPRRHHVVCAMLLTDGREVLGLNIVSNIGVASVCAEQIALGEAMKLHAEAEVSAVITLRATFRQPRSYEIVPPCGRCREVLLEYAPLARIVLRGDTGAVYELVSIGALLPHPFRRREQDRRHGSGEAAVESGS
jgi:cytidine deaminase